MKAQLKHLITLSFSLYVVVTLQIISSVKDLNSDKTFYVDLFPNELPDFLVLEHLLRE